VLLKASVDTTAAAAPQSVPSAAQVELFEPAMCCSSGVCGPSVDQQLITLQDDLRWAEGQGIAVARHNLTSDPDAFVANPKVTGLMTAFGDAALPAVVVDGEIVMHGSYPSRDDLARLAAGTKPAAEEAPRSSDGCGPSGCC
jgi:hypothetical protein